MKLNKDVLTKIKDKFSDDQSDIGKLLVSKVDSYLKLSEMPLEDEEEKGEPPALEALELLLKAILDQITDSIIDEVVDNKLEPEEKMKEHTDSLDQSMDYVLAMGQHFSKMMMQHGDEGMKAFYTKAHSFAMKLADLMKEHRKSMGIDAYKEKEQMYYEAQFGENVSELKALSENTERVAQESLRKLSEELTNKDSTILALKEKLDKRDKEDLVRKAIKDKKLTPSMKEWALSMSVSDLNSYLKIAPTMDISSEKLIDKAPEIVPFEHEVSLSETDMIMIRDLGISKERYLKAKAQKGYK